MKKKILKIFQFTSALVLLLFVSSPVMATNNMVMKISSPEPSFSEFDLLKEKVETLEKLNEKILNTVYWTLGILTTLFLGIIALNIFQNLSININKFNNLEKKLDNKFKTFSSKIKDRCDKDSEKLNKGLDQLVKSKINKALSKLQEAYKNLKESNVELKRSTLYMQAQHYKSKGQQGYILNLIEILNMDIKKDWDFRVSDTLEEILEKIKTTPQPPKILSRLQEALDKLPVKFKKTKELIESNMKS